MTTAYNMDYCRNRLLERERLIAQYAGPSQTPINTSEDLPSENNDTIDIKELQNRFFTLEKLLKDEIQHQLDFNLLDMYLSENIVPRDLRLRCETSSFNDNTFVTEWQDYLHACSRGLLLRLLKKREILFDAFKQNIALAVSDLEQFKQQKKFPLLDRLLLSRVTHFEKETIMKKTKKLY